MKENFTMRLCGSDVTVTHSDPTAWAVGGMGRANAGLGAIELSDKLTPATYHQTLLHEMVHLILDFHGLHNVSGQEATVNILANSLLAWMRDNPSVVKVIIGSNG